MQKNKYLILLTVLCLFCIYIVNNIDYNESKVSISEYKDSQFLSKSNALSLMFETAKDSGEYIQSNDSTWPTGDYVYNETLSKCEKGSKISYNVSTKKVLVEANISDKCYVYFDFEPKILLSDYIKGLYTSNGVNNLYLHNNSLANSAGDNSYRYAGSSETTNNFVCFGSDSTPCQNDDLYRIIGVFDDKVRLIKSDVGTITHLGIDGDYKETYIYSTSKYKGKVEKSKLVGYNFNYKALNDGYGSNDWETSLLNKTNLNTNYINYLNKKNVKWTNMILETKWNIGEHNTFDAISKIFYNAEKAKQTSKSSKIGLMYVSDYGYATIPSNWGTNVSSYDTSSITDNNWMYIGLYEWTITPISSHTNAILYVYDDGRINRGFTSYGNCIRPVFYLNSNVLYISGTGTSDNPYRIG